MPQDRTAVVRPLLFPALLRYKGNEKYADMQENQTQNGLIPDCLP